MKPKDMQTLIGFVLLVVIVCVASVYLKKGCSSSGCSHATHEGHHHHDN